MMGGVAVFVRTLFRCRFVLFRWVLLFSHLLLILLQWTSMGEVIYLKDFSPVKEIRRSCLLLC